MAAQPGELAAWLRCVAPVGLLSVVLSATAPSEASAQSASPITIVWHAPGNCPDRDRVLGSVHALLGGVPPETGRRLTARGDVEAGGFGFALELQTEDETGHRGRRRLSATSCDALADAAALVIALGWDPAAVAATRNVDADGGNPPLAAAPAPVATPGPAPRPPAPTRPPAAPLARPTAPSEASSPALGIAAEVFLDAGGLPGVSVGFGGEVALLLGAYRLGLQGAGYPSSEAALSADARRGGRFNQALGAVRGCRALLPWAGGDSELLGCVGFEAGAVFAEGFGVDAPESATVGWLAPRAGWVGRLALPAGLGARLELGVAFPLVRDPFVLDRFGEVHRATPLVGRFGAGLDLRL